MPPRKGKRGIAEVSSAPRSAAAAEDPPPAYRLSKRRQFAVGKAVADLAPVRQPAAAAQGLVPELAFRLIISGPSNSGKSNLARWLVDKYYRDAFERVYLFSPTAKVDPTWQGVRNLPAGNRITDLGDGRRLEDVFARGIRDVKAKGRDKADNVLVIIDDAICSTKFINSSDFLRLFVQGRHANISVMGMTQSYVKIPRSVRMNATAIALFPSRQTEIERLYSEHGPIEMDKKQFIAMVKSATEVTDEERYPFFFVDTMRPLQSRYRHCLDVCLIPTRD